MNSRKQDMQNYIDSFPFEKYEVKRIPSIGSFYLDSIDDYIKNRLRSGLIWEPYIVQPINQYALPGTTVLDIGAYIGTHTITMAKAVGKNGKVIVFEPQPKIFRELFMNVSLNEISNVSFYWSALGDVNGSIELPPFCERNEGGTSLVKSVEAAATATNGVPYKMEGGTGVFVDLITLDSLDLDDVSCIKMDVEGMEDAVLGGAKNTILRNKPAIILEIMGGNHYHTSPPEIWERIHFTINKVEELGYTVKRIFDPKRLGDNGWDYLAIPT